MEDLICFFFLFFTAIIHHGEAALPLVSLEQLCAQVGDMDCDTEYVSHGDEQTCGMDGVTYDNFCHYAKARCANINLGIANVGSCIENDPRSTLPPDHTTTPVPDVIIQFFCKNTDNIDCTIEDLEPYCGTNGILYKNMCDFAKAKCINPTLDNQSLLNCPDDGSAIHAVGK
ncbi:follistatin-like [Pecten maximus]|uniref:follistatin-like n=1 Tax=Pecten maximus TaxID=6579 RepID=UPI0014580E24|nr:follistatin-like [Pecten maximus]